MAIKCGHCNQAHGSVAEVKRCSEAGRNVPRSLRDNSVAAQMRNLNPSDLIERVSVLLVSREIPEAEWRWSRAIRAYISGQTNQPITEFALRQAIARLEGYPESARPSQEASSTPTARPVRTEDKPVEREGLYRLSRSVTVGREVYLRGTYFQVVRNQRGERLYAKSVEFPPDGVKARPKLTYAAGMIYKLQDDELLPVEAAQEITRKTGWCIFGHFLTRPESIARGMGPKCYERYPHLALNARTEEAA